MAATVSRPFSYRPFWLCFGAGLAFISFDGQVYAQSSGAFATRPYMVPTTQSAPPPSQAIPQGQGAPVYRGPAPVTMFRAPPPPQAEPIQEPVYQEEQPIASPPERPPYSIIAQSQRDAIAREPVQEPAWNPASLEDVVAPPMVASGPVERAGRDPEPQRLDRPGQPYHRRAMRRIFQDTKTSLTYDMPEALADALPWVDRDRKNEPFESVLARVADDLNRAAQSDPEWALGAQRQIRALSKQLDRFPEPPPLQPLDPQLVDVGTTSGIVDINNRPFRPRPIWPGASGRPEAQVRPATIVTETGIQPGPASGGVRAAYVPSAEDAPPADEARRPPSPRQRARHAPPTRR
jgi:hypothetical protein